MTEYEALEQEKCKVYERIKLVKEIIKNTTDAVELSKQKDRLRILEGIYKDYLDNLERLRPVQKKKRKKERISVLHDNSMGSNFFERCNVTFADIEGNQTRWEDLEKEDYVKKYKLLRALRRGKAICSDRQQEILLLHMDGKNVTEIAKETGVNKSTISRILTRAKKIINDVEEIENKASRREDANLLDMSDPKTARYVLSCLTETQAVYLYLYYGEWLSMRDIGQILNVDHSTVCRTIHRAAGRIRALCSDSDDVEVLNFDAVEDMLYTIYKYKDISELIPQKGKEAAHRATKSGYKKRQVTIRKEATIHSNFGKIWEKNGEHTPEQSRLLCSLKEATQKNGNIILSCLRAIIKIFCLNEKSSMSRTTGKLAKFEQGIA